MEQDNYENLLNICSKDLISNEGEIISRLCLDVRNSAISLSIIPFCALYCKSAKEFFNIKSTNNDIEDDVRDLRNGLKIFAGKYSKGLKMTAKSDNQQDEEFKNRLRFRILEKLNLHLNLGVYFTESGRVIFNTQLSNFHLNIPHGKSAFKIGEELGFEIAQILIEQCGVNDSLEQPMIFNSVPKYGYIDFNTNRKNHFFNNAFDKETNLILLHILSMIGGINNLIIPVFKDKNTWLLRIMYVTVHNTWMGIKKMRNHFAQNKAIRFKHLNIEEELNLLSTTFRNCMMHYSFISENGVPSISLKCFDDKVPLYGLVESCYSGMHYEQFYDKLYDFSKKLEIYLLSFFNVDKKKICWDWD